MLASILGRWRNIAISSTTPASTCPSVARNLAGEYVPLAGKGSELRNFALLWPSGLWHSTSAIPLSTSGETGLFRLDLALFI